MTTGAGERELIRRVAVINRTFPGLDLSDRGQNLAEVEDYYQQSSLAYRLLHSRAGAIHMSLSRDGVYHRQGLGTSVEIVRAELPATRWPIRVLELGCGRGYNLRRISGDGLDLMGVDLGRSHVKATQRAVARLPRTSVIRADFHHLPLADNSFDLVFGIESLCHATDDTQVLAEARRVSVTGAKLVVIDAWSSGQWSDAAPELRQVDGLVSRSMSVNRVSGRDEWLETARRANWQYRRSEALTGAVLPNLERFERAAERFFGSPRLACQLARLGPVKLWQNAIAAYLMAPSVRCGAYQYDAVVLKAV